MKSKRIPEAAFFAKTYCPSRISELVDLWKNDLQKSHPVACRISFLLNSPLISILAQKIANPLDYPEQFEDLELCKQIEQFIYAKRAEAEVPAHQFAEYNELLSQDLFGVLKADPNADLSEIKVIPDLVEENPLLAGGEGQEEEEAE